MAQDVWANNASSYLTTAVTTTPTAGTSEVWDVASTTSFPQIGTAEIKQFRLVVGPVSDTDPEIVLCTQIQGNTTLLVLRGAETSTIKTHSVGDPVIHVVTMNALADLYANGEALYWMGVA